MYGWGGGEGFTRGQETNSPELAAERPSGAFLRAV